MNKRQPAVSPLEPLALFLHHYRQTLPPKGDPLELGLYDGMKTEGDKRLEGVVCFGVATSNPAERAARSARPPITTNTTLPPLSCTYLRLLGYFLAQ